MARASARSGGASIAATATLRTAAGGVVPEELVLAFARPLPAGKAEIEIAYDAPFAEDLAGLYRVREAGVYYAYSQFESDDARRAFPCSTSPGSRRCTTSSLRRPPTTALTNASEVSQAPAPDGAVIHTFATSRPLPSYLVALAVGPFDLVEGQKEPFPIRVVTTKGRGNLAGLALDVAAALVAKLADYFGVAYPYDKLDLVAVPDFAAGAMENPGLVTFRDVLLPGRPGPHRPPRSVDRRPWSSPTSSHTSGSATW